METPLETLLQDIAEPNQTPARKLLHDLQTYIPEAAGSTKSHHAWPGGYNDHIQETMNLARIVYKRMSQERPLPFSLASAYLVLYLHDCEKPFRHASDEQLTHFPWITSRPDKSDKDFQRLLVTQYGFIISDAEWNALHYVEGEPESEYVEGNRLQGPLAAFCHSCDTMSARIWFDHPNRRAQGQQI